MRDQTEAEIGATVYLRPTTKQAPRICWLQLAAVVVSYEAWPMVVVRVFRAEDDGRGSEHRVHKDNIGLRRKTAVKEKGGDTTQQHDEGPGMIGRRIARPVAPLPPDCGYDEPMLF